jgi:hypothetical protein
MIKSSKETTFNASNKTIIEVYIKRLSTQQKSDRSSLICEAISLLFEKEKDLV